MMPILLIVALAAGEPGVGPLRPAADRLGNLDEAIYLASEGATGRGLCDRARAERYAADFDRRYGNRIEALKRSYHARFGPDRDFTVVNTCRLKRHQMLDGTYSYAINEDAEREEHQAAMDAFDATLKQLEDRYGQPPVRK